MKKQVRGYAPADEAPVQKSNTLMARTDKVFNTVDAATPEADQDAHGIPAASKGSAKIREERTVEGIVALGNALRSPGGASGNRGYTFATHGNQPHLSPNQITTNQARRLLQLYSSDPRPAVSGAAKRALGG